MIEIISLVRLSSARLPRQNLHEFDPSSILLAKELYQKPMSIAAQRLKCFVLRALGKTRAL